MWNREQNPDVNSAKVSLHLITYCTVVTTCSGRGELTTRRLLTNSCMYKSLGYQMDYPKQTECFLFPNAIMLTKNGLLTYSFQRLQVCFTHYLGERLVRTERINEREITQWLRVQRRNTQSHRIVKRDQGLEVKTVVKGKLCL